MELEKQKHIIMKEIEKKFSKIFDKNLKIDVYKCI